MSFEMAGASARSAFPARPDPDSSSRAEACSASGPLPSDHDPNQARQITSFVPGSSMPMRAPRSPPTSTAMRLIAANSSSRSRSRTSAQLIRLENSRMRVRRRRSRRSFDSVNARSTAAGRRIRLVFST